MPWPVTFVDRRKSGVCQSWGKLEISYLTSAGNGGHPCANCIDRKRECVRPAGSRARHKYGSRDYSTLTDRLARLETMLEKSQSDSRARSIMTASLPPSVNPTRTDSSSTPPVIDLTRRPTTSDMSDERQSLPNFDQSLLAMSESGIGSRLL